MLYWLFRYLNENTDLPGMRVGEYISFRSAAAIIISLLIAIFAGKHIIRMLRRKQIGEDIRDLGLEGQLQKKGTPTMGGIIIILSLIIPVLLFGNLGNVYVQLMIISTLWLGFLGGLDDYIKVFRHNKEGRLPQQWCRQHGCHDLYYLLWSKMLRAYCVQSCSHTCRPRSHCHRHQRQRIAPRPR